MRTSVIFMSRTEAIMYLSQIVTLRRCCEERMGDQRSTKEYKGSTMMQAL